MAEYGKAGEPSWKKLFELLPERQKAGFFFILIILGVSAVLSQLTPLAVGYLTDHVLAEPTGDFLSVIPILMAILLVNVANEVLKVVRRLIVEDAARRAHRLERVNVVPQPKAGSSFATAAWQAMESPCAVEEVRARAGIDVDHIPVLEHVDGWDRVDHRDRCDHRAGGDDGLRGFIYDRRRCDPMDHQVVHDERSHGAPLSLGEHEDLAGDVPSVSDTEVACGAVHPSEEAEGLVQLDHLPGCGT